MSNLNTITKSVDGRFSILVKKRPHFEHRLYEKINSTTNDPLNNMNFGLQVSKHVLQDALTNNDNGMNMICSPLSITAVLNILAAGATGGMLRQLLGVLECHDMEEANAFSSRLMEVLKGSHDEDAPDICFANALWVSHQFPLKAPFQQALRDVHKAEARSVDFENQVDDFVKEANLWVEEQTRGLIKQILSEKAISKDTMMILANALYFKGVWVQTFKRKNTKDQKFYFLNDDEVQVPFMTQCKERFDYGTLGDCQVLRMLYREGENQEPSRSFSMYIFLPNKKHGLLNLMENVQIDSDMFKDRIKLKYKKIRELSIPKFSFECDLPLIEVMKKMDLTLPFSKDCRELSAMVESPNGDWPYVTDILQKCRIEVSEKGTKADTFTRVPMSLGYSPSGISFVADHPFMFMIREDFSGAILFVGTVLDPRFT